VLLLDGWYAIFVPWDGIVEDNENQIGKVIRVVRIFWLLSSIVV
jgi:hypothetical protein